MASGQTPRRRPASRSGEPAAGFQADGANDASAAEGSSTESLTGQPKPVARRRARPSTGNAAVGAATSDRLAAAAAAAVAATTPGPVASANPPVTVEGYVRAPARDVAGLTRAHHDEPQAAVPDDPTRKYMRPSPEVLGITRAAPAAEEAAAGSARPAPLFSNEGIVRQSEARHSGRIPGPIAGIFPALLAAGTVLGHELSGAKSAVTRGGIGKTHVSGGTAIAQVTGSPDFDRFGNKRTGRGRRRAAGAMAFVGILGVAIFAVAMTSVLPPAPSSSIPPGSPAATSNDLMANALSRPNDNIVVEPTADLIVEATVVPTSVLVGDESLAPGATRSPTAKPGTPKPTSVPTAVPTATPVRTPAPSATPAPTAIPAAPAIDTQEASPLQLPTLATFWVFYIPSSSCYITRTYVSGHTGPPPPQSKTGRFQLGTDGRSGPIQKGPKADQYGVYAVTATCTAPGGVDVTSPALPFEWTSAPSPTPKGPGASAAPSATGA